MFNEAFNRLVYTSSLLPDAHAQTLFFEGVMPTEQELASLLGTEWQVSTVPNLITWVQANGGKYVANCSVAGAQQSFYSANRLKYAFNRSVLSVLTAGTLQWFVMFIRNTGNAPESAGNCFFCLAGTITDYANDGDMLTGTVTVDLATVSNLLTVQVAL